MKRIKYSVTEMRDLRATIAGAYETAQNSAKARITATKIEDLRTWKVGESERPLFIDRLRGYAIPDRLPDLRGMVDKRAALCDQLTRTIIDLEEINVEILSTLKELPPKNHRWIAGILK